MPGGQTLWVDDEVAASDADLSLWCRRWLGVTRGRIADVEGRRTDAVARYEEVIALRSRWDSERSVRLAQEGLEEPYRLPGPQIVPMASPPPPAALPST